MNTYKIGSYSETVEGRAFKVMWTGKCDSDAQAEATARRLAEYNGIDGLHIQRGDVEWYVQP
jgi:hypothetical protein